MAETKFYSLHAQLDIEQILQEAQHRWLRPAEICQILQNHHNFQIAPEPPNKPPSGSIFLFNRKELRYFRKDGHNWRKKRDGKTVKEAHERLKSGSVEVLHCYYAHGEENESFQRRCYWLLEDDKSHIVLVHYQEVKGSRSNHKSTKDAGDAFYSDPGNGDVLNLNVDRCASSNISSHDHPLNSQVTVAYQRTSQSTDTASLSSAQTSEYEDAESAYNQTSSRVHNSIASQPLLRKIDDGFATPYYPFSSSSNYQGLCAASIGMTVDSTVQGGREKNLTGGVEFEQNQPLGSQSCNDILKYISAAHQPSQYNPSFSQLHEINAFSGTPSGPQSALHSSNDHQISYHLNAEQKADCLPRKSLILDGLKGGLKKLDSFDNWMSKELGDVDESHLQSSSGAYWEGVGSEDGIDGSDIGSQPPMDSFVLDPSLSQDQYFSITDFSPGWAYAGSEIKVLIFGNFLKNPQEVQNCKFACMFGELEVHAEIVAGGLRCQTPVRKAGKVPFYITLSNRLACSEVREFEFRTGVCENGDVPDTSIFPVSESLLLVKFARMLSLGSSDSPTSVPSNMGDTSQMCNKISSLLRQDKNEWDKMLNLDLEDGSSKVKIKDQLLQMFLKEKLHNWLLKKISGGGKGPAVLDEGGQGVLHLSAALDYDWAIPPMIAAGLNINFRDSNGWNALHWAALYGRERTVCSLISLGAAAGALTDPTPKCPSGRPPADLASSNGHKGIAALLAECALSSHLKSLELSGESSAPTFVQTISERTANPYADGDSPLKESLAAVRNAAQAAARIHQVFRVQSFQRKKLNEYGDGEFGMSSERALSLLALKTNRSGQHDEPVQAAATRIQNKFRSWKGRKDFLLIRQRIIKIQAHFRGHQVRKRSKFIWSVGILEKVVLRWRRKGSGFRGFRPETVTEGTSMQNESSKGDDYDVLKEGRQQAEKRIQKALERVKSMVQYPEARDQYQRLLNVVSGMQETKDVDDNVLKSSEEVDDFDDMLDLQALLGDDTFMST